MKRTLSCLAGLAILGLSTSAFAAPGDSLEAGDPDTTFTLSDYVASDTVQITNIRFLPDGRMLIAEKTGNLKLRQADGTLKTILTLKVTTTSEQGLIGLAVQPDFATSRRIVVYWTRANDVGGSDQNRINVSSFVMQADDMVDMASEKILVKDITAPANHDGGGLSFGPDGLLYIGVGDNGCNESIPTGRLHQNLRATSFNYANGKVLRVAVDGTVPTTNPWVNVTGPISGVGAPYTCTTSRAGTTVPTTTDPIRKDIYAAGFRNPFRLWVDPKTSYVWVGDVGEVTYEEVDIVTKGGQHFGWPFLEGQEDGGQGPWTVAKCAELTPSPGNCVPPAHVCDQATAAASREASSSTRASSRRPGEARTSSPTTSRARSIRPRPRPLATASCRARERSSPRSPGRPVSGRPTCKRAPMVRSTWRRSRRRQEIAEFCASSRRPPRTMRTARLPRRPTRARVLRTAAAVAVAVAVVEMRERPPTPPPPIPPRSTIAGVDARRRGRPRARPWPSLRSERSASWSRDVAAAVDRSFGERAAIPRPEGKSSSGRGSP
jgi:glucose/arabinose dehydrogenase